MRMLVVNERLAMIRFAGLKQLRKPGMWRCQRLRGKHLPEQNSPLTQAMLLHQHRPVNRLGFPGAAGSTLIVEGCKDHAMSHEVPAGADVGHPFMPGNGR